MTTQTARPATPLIDAWWTGPQGAGGGTPDWNDGGTEPISEAHLALERWFGPNATEIASPAIAALRVEYDTVSAYLEIADRAGPPAPPAPPAEEKTATDVAPMESPAAPAAPAAPIVNGEHVSEDTAAAAQDQKDAEHPHTSRILAVIDALKKDFQIVGHWTIAELHDIAHTL